ncbi:hypothetical protein SAMN02745166_04888 [Prosthecobacter debontii]|uniref:Uncharacterized protein n=1 Tax=Prosthecobacter debontii TaxID=48467 RepID=A0A1T4Z2H7_9BACT|nr:hypothetical protein [Prosthecobacter debontii]SKB08240.1 hypothetical protein SAMN02745166_04888 [Prosthecobacter debontii]
MLSFYPIVCQVTEDPRSPWVLPGAVIFVWVIARWFFARKSLPLAAPEKPAEKVCVAKENADASPREPTTSPLVAPQTIPGTDLVYLVFSQPPMARYAMASSCYTRKLEPTLTAALSQCGPEVFMILAANDSTVFIQNREYAGQLPRQSLKAIRLHPILPAKGGGMVSLYFEHEEEGQSTIQEFMACPVYSPELQQWCLRRAEEVGAMLHLPVKVAPSSHDC